MDQHLFRNCALEQIEKAKELEEQKQQKTSEENSDEFEYLPCQKKFRLHAEDEISLDSIFSAILSMIEPSEKEFKTCTWDINAKELLNEKQAIIFEEKLYISQLQGTNCKLSEETKIFLESELQQVGEYDLNIEESYDGYVVYSTSYMAKGKNKTTCGHTLTGKYDNHFLLIVEKRMEYDHIDNARIEKTLKARLKEDTMTAVRETKINHEVNRYKAVINMKGREDIFVLDGGVMLLMRYLIVNNFRGEFQYYSMNLFGKIVYCKLIVREERKKVRIFYRTYQNVICVMNTQYFNDVAEEITETFYTADGHIVLHFWHGYNYILHAVKAPVKKPKERILPKLELMWKADNLLSKKYEREKKLNYENAMDYLKEHPEFSDFLYDYVLTMLKFKPTNVLEFTVKFFQNMKSAY